MTHPDQSASRGGSRPQLFSRHNEKSTRQDDFGPSILAAIEGLPRGRAVRKTVRHGRVTTLIGLLALAVVCAYVAAKVGVLPRASDVEPETTIVRSAAPATSDGTRAVTPLTSDEPAVAGSALIQNVGDADAAAIARTAAPASGAGHAMVVSTGGEVIVSSAGDAEAEKAGALPANSVAKLRTPNAKERPPVRESTRQSPAPKTWKSTPGDGDAALLAAMLPHLRRHSPLPTSAAYERRCGDLMGDAAAACRVRFCNGREGADVTCPKAPSP